MGGAMLKGEDLTITPILKNGSFHVALNETVILQGPSGAGKTTFIHALLGLNKALISGTLLFEGAPFHPRLLGKKIGMIFQDPHAALNPRLPVGKQIAEGMVTHLGYSWKKSYQEAADLLEELGTTPCMECYPFELSGGMKQLVTIAIALASRPSFLIADEITSSLDKEREELLIALLKRLKKERHLTLLLITHSQSLAQATADRLYTLNEGILQCSK